MKRNSLGYTLLYLVVIIIFTLISRYYSTHSTSAPVLQNQSVASTTKAGASTLYPDPTLTPGDILTTDANVVCASGYSSTVRNVPVAEKKQVYQEYGKAYPQPAGANEVDHFISLELGGSNEIKNLWLEPAEPRPGFHEKDIVENYLHEQVCSKNMTLPEAQHEIATDWYAVYLKIAQ